MNTSYWVAVAVGLSIGGTVGFLAVRNIGTTWKAIATRAGVLLFFALGSAYAAPFIAEGMVGGIFPEPPVEDEISARLRERPVMARVFRDFPDVEKQFRQRGAAAYRAGGDQALMEELERATQETFEAARSHYMPRAQDADLLRFTLELVKIIKGLADKDPVLCALWMSPPSGGEFIVSSDISKVVGDMPMISFEQSADAAIANAGIAIPDYDKSRAEAIIKAVGTDIIVRSGLNTLQMLSGQKPVKSADDAKKLCTAAAQMYERITQYRREDAVGALRHVMRGMEKKPEPSSSS
jgi:hypothetical protein